MSDTGGAQRTTNRRDGSPGVTLWLRWVGANALATIVTPIVGTIAFLALGGLAVLISMVVMRPLVERMGLLISGPIDTALNWGIEIFLIGPGLAAIGWGLGAFVGWIQSIALRGLISEPKRWIRSSRIGWTAGLPLGFGLASFLVIRSFSGNLAIAGPGIVFPLMIATIGSVVFAIAVANLVGALLQTRIIAARPSRGIWWVMTNIFAWASGLLAAGAVAYLEFVVLTSGEGLLESLSSIFRGTPFWPAINLGMPLIAVVAVLGAMGGSAGAISGLVLHRLAGRDAATPEGASV